MALVVVESLDEFHQIDGVVERIRRAIVVGLISRGIATKGKNSADPFLGIPFEDSFNFGFGVAHAGEVRDWRD